jgi:hypothetical protein
MRLCVSGVQLIEGQRAFALIRDAQETAGTSPTAGNAASAAATGKR